MLAEYIRLTERLLAVIEDGDMAEEDKVRDEMDPLWWRLTDEEIGAVTAYNEKAFRRENESSSDPSEANR